MLLERSETSDRNVGREELLEREILEIADHEKELLARELHDGLCQLLAGIVALGSSAFPYPGGERATRPGRGSERDRPTLEGGDWRGP